MATRRKTLARIELCEAVIDGKTHEVDRATGVIRRVKMLGRSSPNKHGRKDCDGTEYSDTALESAAKLMEGRKAYIDHPANRNAKAERSLRDLAGVYSNCTVEPDGVYGDLQGPPQSANFQLVADWAEHHPTAFGLSQNAFGTGRMKGRKQIIESIDKVRSIDIVCDPATTRGLYESRENAMAGKTILETLEELGISARAAKTLLEMDGFAGGDAPVETAAPAVAPEEEDAATHLARAVTAFMSDDTIDAGKKKKKINQILAILDDASDAAPPTETLPEAAAEGEGEGEGKKEDKMESLEAEVKKLRDKDAVRSLCESLEYRPSPVKFTALLNLPEAERKAFITEEKQIAKAATTAPAKGPRSNSSASLLESQKAPTGPAKDSKEFLARIYG